MTTVKTEAAFTLPIVERLRRRRTGSYRRLMANPDGPAAADTIEDLYEALEGLQRAANEPRTDAGVIPVSLLTALGRAGAALAKARGEA